MNLSQLGADDNAALKDIIRGRIRSAGPISFAEFLSLALYHPRHGYYFACDPTRDYESSPNVHPVFGAMVARQLAGFWRLLGRPARFDVFEAGAGSGRLAADVLRALRAEEPDLYDAVRYVAQDVTYGGPLAAAEPSRPNHPVRPEPVEGRSAGGESSFDPSAGLRAGKLRTNVSPAELSADNVGGAPDLPSSPEIDGCVLSNELLDALPFQRVRKRDGRLYELRVGLEDGRFVDVEVEPSDTIRNYFAALGVEPGEGCEAEVNLEAIAWTRRAAAALRRGYVLTLDYGYEAPELYAPWRKRGTLLTFYRHTSGEDPYVRVGRQDITASVDFTSVMRAGESAGLRTLGLTTQTEFLAALGIGEALAQPPAAGEIEAFYALRRAVMELTDPSGLGRIRVLIQSKGVPEAKPKGLLAATRPGGEE